MSKSLTWFAITVEPIESTLSSDAFDGLCSELVEMGASGTAVDQAPLITCYLEGNEEAVRAFIAKLAEVNCRLISYNHVKQENWTGACAEVWEPINAGTLTVIPVESPSDPRPSPEGSIRIIPGLGFGTGHHATTRMVLTALSDLHRNPPSAAGGYTSALDFGTGSGILAIAATKLFGVSVDAIDIDPGALENARDNLVINNASDTISLSTTPIEKLHKSYDLILANVYGEVLTASAGEVSRLARPGALAILSGITEIVWPMVWEAYGSRYGWELETLNSEGGWVCAVLRASYTNQ
jgi:ribosomal protein L11 methyltransferase